MQNFTDEQLQAKIKAIEEAQIQIHREAIAARTKVGAGYLEKYASVKPQVPTHSTSNPAPVVLMFGSFDQYHQVPAREDGLRSGPYSSSPSPASSVSQPMTQDRGFSPQYETATPWSQSHSSSSTYGAAISQSQSYGRSSGYDTAVAVCSPPQEPPTGYSDVSYSSRLSSGSGSNREACSFNQAPTTTHSFGKGCWGGGGSPVEACSSSVPQAWGGGATVRESSSVANPSLVRASPMSFSAANPSLDRATKMAAQRAILAEADGLAARR
jgi:hypothetical protein